MERVGVARVGRCQEVNNLPDRWDQINPDRSLYVAMVTRLPGEHLSVWKRKVHFIFGSQRWIKYVVLDGVYGMLHGFRCLLKCQNKNDKVNSPGFLVRNNQVSFPCCD